MTSSKYFERSCLIRVAMTVGCIHILGSLWNILTAVFDLATPNPDFGEINYNDAIIEISIASLFEFAGLFLIFGTLKESHLMLLPWLVIEGFGLFIYFMYNSTNLIDPSLHNWQTFAFIMLKYTIIGLCVYVWFAILTLYQIFREENQTRKQDDEETLCADSESNQVLPSKKSHFSTYVIPVAYSKVNLPPSQLKY